MEYQNLPPKQPTFSTKFYDSGLVSLSSFEIVQTGFKPFKFSTGRDNSYYKGLAYTKIELRPGTKYLHLFNVDLQSTPERKYYSKDKKQFHVRLKQIIQLRKFIDEFLEEFSSIKEDGPYNFKDVILLAGVFGLNARNCNIPVKELKLSQIKKMDERAGIWIEQNLEEAALDANKPDKMFQCFSEYDYLNHVLSNYDEDILLNIALDELDGKHPVTFGDCFNKNRQMIPREKILTPKKSYNSEKCLDYVFQLLPGGNYRNSVKAECKILPFFIDMDEDEEIKEKISQLSSHYGLRLRFEV